MAQRRAIRTLAMLFSVILVTTLTVGCSDDDETSSGDTTTSTTEETRDPGDTPATDAADDEPGEAEPRTPLLDLVDAKVAGRQLGEPAEPTIDRLIEVLGPPEVDTGWQPSECPPATEARNLAWGGLYVYFGYLDEPVLDGARLDLAELDPDEVPPVRLPDGVELGAPIEEVASAVDATAIYDEAFDWWEVWVAAPDVAVQYLAGPEGVLDQVMLGYVPVCR